MLQRKFSLRSLNGFACIILVMQAAIWSNSAYANRADSNQSERQTSTLSLLHESGRPNRLSFEDDLGVILFEAIVNDRSVWAILDNGAGNTIIDTGLARELNLQVESATGTIRTTHSETEKSTVNGVRLEVPGQFEIAGNFVGADLTAISEVTGKEVSLILGSDILNNLCYLVDAKNRRMIFVLAGGMNPRSPSAKVISLSNGVLEGTLNGSPARFQVDLGSNSPLLVLRDSWTKYFGMTDTSSVSRSIDLSGAVVERDEVEDVMISISGIEAMHDARQVSFSRFGVDGFLGFPVFRDRVVIFDYRNDRIFLLD